MTALSVTGLGVAYGDVDALTGVDVQIGHGEVVALLGANGAGKTTFVRAVAGLLPARAGVVQLMGVDITSAPTHRRAGMGLAVVTDARSLCSSMRVDDNLRLARGSDATRHEVETWLPEIGELHARRAGTLSGGERALVALARALLMRPRVVVVDEFTAGVARPFAVAAVGALRQAAQHWGTGVLIVEQATQLALRTADRAVVLSRGRVAVEGAAAELAQRPEVLQVAYLGEG